MQETIFDRILRREIAADIVYESDEVLGFRDIAPQAPVHVLFIPKKRIATLDDLAESDASLIGRLVLAATAYARAQGLHDSGYRCVINCGTDGGQSVNHIHLHLLAGRRMNWPPG